MARRKTLAAKLTGGVTGKAKPFGGVSTGKVTAPPAVTGTSSNLGARMRGAAGTIVGSATNQGTVASDRTGKTHTTQITASGRIAHAYGDGAKPLVLNEAQTLAEVNKLPPGVRSEVKRRMRAFKKKQAASSGGAQAPSA